LDKEIVSRCCDKLKFLAMKGERITYGELALYLGVTNQSVGEYLNEVYEAEIRLGDHDLTLLAHYSNSWFGKCNSHGLVPQSIGVDPDNLAEVKAYKNDLKDLFSHWGGLPKGKLKKWLNS